MKIEHKRIIEEVSKENNIDIDIVKSISDTVFKSWSDWIRSPDTLILKIKGLGKNYFRKEKVKNKLAQLYGCEAPELQSFLNSLEFVIKEYETYTAYKHSFRCNNKDPEQTGDKSNEGEPN